MKAVALPLLLAAFLLPAGAARADEEQAEPVEQTAPAAPRHEAAGWHVDFTLGNTSREGQTGPSGGIRWGYGFKSGPVVIGPQMSMDLAISNDAGAIGIVPGMRLELPIEHFGPYIVGGIGFGYATGNSQDKLQPMVEGGGGFFYHVGSHVGLGLEALYIAGYDSQGGTRSFYGGWRYGPMIAAIF